MIRNYFITALRNLFRNKVNTTINVLGLTLGITCSLVLFLIVRFELSFDKHFAEADRIYRILTETVTEDGEINLTSGNLFPFVKTFKSDFEDIPVTFVENNFSSPSIYVEQNGESVRYQESADRAAFVHPDYPKIFSHDWLYGDPETALQEINSVVLTRKIAMKYFNRLDVVGETLGYNEEATLKITGVIEDYPKATDLPLDLIFSIETHAQYRDEIERWGGDYSSLHCFVKLPAGMTPESLEARMEGFDARHRGEKYEEGYTRLLQPISEMHYATTLQNFSGNTISRNNLLAVGLIGALLLFAACMNFVNLNTALAMKRAKEVGVRKVLGGSRLQLFAQFMGETFLITLCATLISLGGVELTLIQVEQHLGYDLDFNVIRDAGVAFFLIFVLFFSVIFSGLYPSLIMSAFKPVSALKNKVGVGKGKGVSLRKVLVTLQLTISQVLIICTVLAVRQMDHFYNTPLGLNPESVVEIYVGGGAPERNTLFRTRLLEIPGIDKVTFSNTGAISGNLWAGSAKATINDEPFQEFAHVKFVDEHFLDTYGITLLAGENVRPTESTAESSLQYIINEQLMKEMGIEDPNEVLGLPISIWGKNGFVKGVIADFNTQSLHSGMNNIMMAYEEGYGSCALRLQTAEVSNLLKEVESVFVDVYPGNDFETSFLDETIAGFYEEEQKASTLFQVAAGVAIFIGCIGMIGLISYMASRKVKEVGIRKVLGASVTNILLLFSRQFLLLTITGFIIASPMAYYLMRNWLANYEYRIDIGPGTFALGLLLTLILVVLSTGFRAYHSANSNPVKSLRSE